LPNDSRARRTSPCINAIEADTYWPSQKNINWQPSQAAFQPSCDARGWGREAWCETSSLRFSKKFSMKQKKGERT
jgi:hypothetical protein